MSKSKQLNKIEPEEKEAHNAIVKAVFALIKMIIAFFTGRKKKNDTNV